MNFQLYNEETHFSILQQWYEDKNILNAMEIEPMSEEELARWLAEPDRVHLVFFQDNTPVGCVNFYHYKTQSPNYELGYLIDPAQQGKGFATEMVRQSLEYAKDNLSVEKIEEVYVIESNLGSKRVLEKNGFTLDRYDEEKRRYYFYKELNVHASGVTYAEE